MVNQLLIWLFYQFPEVLLLIYTGPKLIGLAIESRKLIISSLIFSSIVPLLRAFLPFGWHTLAIFSLFILLIHILYQTPFQTTVIASIISFSLLLLGEFAVLIFLTPPLETNSIVLLGTPLTHILFGYASNVLLVVALICSHLGFRLFNAPKSEDNFPQ